MIMIYFINCGDDDDNDDDGVGGGGDQNGFPDCK